MQTRVSGNFLFNDKDIRNSLVIAQIPDDEAAANKKLMIKRCLRKVIEEQLSPRQKTYLMLYYYEEDSMRKIAESYGVNISTVSRTITRAKHKIEHYLRYYTQT